MATYIALARFTDQGIRSVKDTTQRAAAVQAAASTFGASLSQIFWTHGQYDLVTIIDAVDEKSATAFALAISTAGNIRMETMRAFNCEEMGEILEKVP